MDKLKEELSGMTREEVIDSAILKNITGGTDPDAKDGGGKGSAKCCQNYWRETCGSSGGDFCGQYDEPPKITPDPPQGV